MLVPASGRPSMSLVLGIGDPMSVGLWYTDARRSLYAEAGVGSTGDIRDGEHSDEVKNQ